MKYNNIYKQYFTPTDIADIIIDNVDIKSVNNAIDLSVGEGELLIACSKKWRNAKLVGFDIDNDVLNKFRGKTIDNIEIINGNSLEDGTYLQSLSCNEILANGGFDLCIGNPPFDAYYKIDLKGKKVNIPIEYLFLKRYISVCKDNGYVVIILPNGILTNKYNKYIREEILQLTTVVKVISLPYNVFSKAHAKTEVLVLKKKVDLNKGKFEIEFINIDNNLEIKQYKVSMISKSDLVERMDSEYYINKNSISNIKMERLVNVKFKKLSDITKEHGRGATVYGEKRYFVSDGLKYLHTTNITHIGIQYSKKELYIEENSIMDKKSGHTKIGDVLLVRVGKNCAGRVAIVDSAEDIGVASDCIYIFRIKDIDPYYFVIVMKTKFMKKRLKLLMHGSCASVISKQDLLNLQIPILDNKIQKNVHSKYKKILKNYRKVNNKNDVNNLSNELIELIGSIDELLRREEYYEISS